MHFIFDLDAALKFVKKLIRAFTVDDTSIECLEAVLLSRGKLKHLLICLLMLQISFTIEIFSFYKTDSFGQGTLNNVHIAREKLIFPNLNEAAHLNVLSSGLGELVPPTAHTLTGRLVFLCIFKASLSIFKNVFDHRNKHHETQRRHRGHESTLRGNTWNKLDRCHHQEVSIRQFGELFP